MRGRVEMIHLWEKDVPGYDPALGQLIPNITPYLIEDGQEHSCILVCPGGGYSHKAQHEGEPIAQWLNSIGISAFVLDYRVAPYKHPWPLSDAQRAIRTIRSNSAKWHIDKNRVGILGFSAGGHLTSTAATHFDAGNKAAADPIERESSRPDAAVLCYPVISFGEFRHHGSMVNLLGENPPEDLRHNLSNENAVGPNTPPVFLWHTSDDAAVPVENSLLFASSMARHKLNFALHVYRSGRHGLGLANEFPEVSQWKKECELWLRAIGF